MDRSPSYLVGHPPVRITDAAPVPDADTGYHPHARLRSLPASGAWREGNDPGDRRFVEIGTQVLESGESLDVTVAYETWGQLNEDGSNAILVCHALTGDSHVRSEDGTEGWWPGIVGPGKAIDTDKYYVVAPNVLGGCQGTTGPSSKHPDGKPWARRFPRLTVRDQVATEKALMDYLGVPRWHLVAGASAGGHRVMEWPATYPDHVEQFAVLVSAPETTAEQIAYAHQQILAIELDPAWRGGDYYDAPAGQGPYAGLGLARAIAHTTYRCSTELDSRFDRTPQEGEDPMDGGRFAVQSYLDYHGYKLAARFDANSYLTLTEAMITHSIGRGRGGVDAVLAGMTQRALVVSVDTDRLFHPADQQRLADSLPGCDGLVTIHSDHGHDGFLVENSQVGEIISTFLAGSTPTAI